MFSSKREAPPASFRCAVYPESRARGVLTAKACDGFCGPACHGYGAGESLFGDEEQ